MIVKKRTRMKLTALFLTCICFVTSVGSCYYGPGIQAVSAQEVQMEGAQDSTLTVDDEAVDEDAQNLSAGGGVQTYQRTARNQQIRLSICFLTKLEIKKERQTVSLQIQKTVLVM